MRNLPCPSINDRILLTNVINDKSKAIANRLRRKRATVKRAYNEYSNFSTCLENIQKIGLNGVCEKAYIHAYNVRTNSSRVMRDELLNPDIEDFDVCPYCNINEPKTLDHYLPKEDYPEFSIFSKNLIPICGVCNSDFKGTKFLDNNGQRLFIHTYYDIIPNFDFISTSVNINNKITLTFTPNSDPRNLYFSNIFRNHFHKLSLNERYIRKAATEIKRKRNTFSRIYNRNNSPIDVRNSITSKAREYRDELGGNHWKVSLYEGLANSQSFCNQGFLKAVKK